MWFLLFQIVLINELNTDPVDGWPSYVEVVNIGTVPIDLNGWRLQRRQVAGETARPIATAPLLLQPGAYLVLTADSAALAARAGPGAYRSMPRYPPYNRASPDEVRLFDAAGVLVDLVAYDPSVWGRGTAFERRSWSAPGSHIANWAPGYSPGVPNAAPTDRDGPRPIRHALSPDGRLAIRFSEPLDDGGEWRLFGPFADSVATVDLSAVRDVFGNPTPEATYTARIRYPGAAWRILVLNEFRLQGAERWVELHNVSAQPLDLSGWSVNSTRIPREEPFAGFHIPVEVVAGGYHLLPGLPTFLKTRGALGIRSHTALLVDTLAYDARWSIPDDRSMERSWPSVPTADPQNWVPHPTADSRGAINRAHAPPASPPRLRMAEQLAGGLRLRFDRHLEPAGGERLMVDGSEVPIPPVDPIQADTWWIPGATGHRVRLESEAQVYDSHIAHPPGAEDLRITEVHHRPTAEQAPFVEVRNNADRAVSLEGTGLRGVSDPGGATAFAWLPPGGYAIYHADTLEEGRLLAAWPEAREAVRIRYVRSTLPHAKTAGTVVLTAGGDRALDSLTYDSSWHHPVYGDADGRSLEKRDPGGRSTDPTGWTTNTSASGATPGRENSVWRGAVGPPGGRVLHAEPNPFSPDGDGRDEATLLVVHPPDPGQALRVRIFDRYGTLVRGLASDHPAGARTELHWDGLDDRRRPVPPGAYLVLVETYGGGPGRAYRLVVAVARSYR